jgi:hypothetical protein
VSRFVEVRPVADCFDADLVREVELDQALDEPVMRALAVEASLQYYPDFPRPYFRIERPGDCTLQGVLGAATFRITFTRTASADRGRSVIAHLQALLAKKGD